MTRYGSHANVLVTPQTEQARPDQVKNNAGGFVFDIGPWKQLDRFLVLGQVGSTYYASEKSVVKNNVEALRKCLAEDGVRVVNRIVEISDAGRAPKNDPAVFALAVAAGDANPATRKAALQALPKVCRIGTHLFQFLEDVTGQRRWGRGLRTAVAKWYTERSIESLALQAVKYKQRNGWSHRDVLRLSHPTPTSPAMNATFAYMAGKEPPHEIPTLVAAAIAIHQVKTAKEAASIVEQYKLPRECVPTQWLNEPIVWEALIPHMGPTAMIRNLGKMTSIGMFQPMSSLTKQVAERISDREALERGRVHPIALLLALGVYAKGHGERGKLTWQPVRELLEACDAGFYAAFDNVEPTGKNTLIALDVSGSMGCGEIAGAPGINPRIASAAMAMVTARAEKSWHVMGFCHRLVPIDLRTHDPLDAVVRKVSSLPFGATDCSLPMTYATQNKLEVDVFQVYTDNETYFGQVHPFQALRQYRQASGRNAKLVVAGLTATGFSIADPTDPGMLDVVGFDAAAPAIMADFARGEV